VNHQLNSANSSSLSVFDFQSQPVRLLTRNNDPWFVAKDICAAVEIKNSRHALSRLDDDEKNTVVLNDGTPGNPNTAIVSESGMYTLVLSSRKPSAKLFRKWVTSEVLPTIRKTGGYFHAQPESDPTPIDQNLISNIQNLKLKIAQQPEIYRLIFSSRLKEATNFQQWVFEHVLPAVCQTGMYAQLSESEFAPILRSETLWPPIARTGNSSTSTTPGTPGTGGTSGGFGGAGSGGTGNGGGDDGGDDDDFNEDDEDEEYYQRYEYDNLSAPIDLDEQFLQIDYVFDNLPYDCRQNLTMEIQKRRVLQELIAAFPPNKKFLLSRDTAIALADAERYFTIEQLADRLERMAGMPVSADRVVTLLEEMGYIAVGEDLVEAITPTQSARFFTRRVAGEMKWRANILQLLLWEYNWQMKNRKSGGRSV